MTEPTTHTLDVPGAVLTYDVRSNDVRHRAGPAADRIADGRRRVRHAGRALRRPHGRDVRPPRGWERSKRTDGASETTPDEHADDLHRLIAALGAGPVDVFASSGGAVNALALVARHPEQVRTLVAHEPPAAQVLPDREAVAGRVADIHETYLRERLRAGDGEVHRARQPRRPDPGRLRRPARARSGDVRAPDRGRRLPRRPAASGRTCLRASAYRHDFDALRARRPASSSASARESKADDAAVPRIAVAERLGTAPRHLPGRPRRIPRRRVRRQGNPDAFAATLRQVLND